MKCKKCNKEIDDNILICPECGAIQKEEEKNLHYNYSNDMIKKTVASLTEVPYDQEYEEQRNKNYSKKLLKTPIFLIINIIYFSILSIIIYIFFKSDNHILLLFYLLLFVWFISATSYELMFHKAGAKWFMGLIPLFRIITILKIRNDTRLKDQLAKTEPLILFWVIYLIFYLVSGGGGLFYIYLLFIFIFICAFIYTLVLYIIYRIDVLTDLAARFNNGTNKNKYKTIIFPFFMIMYYGYFDKYKYTKLSDSYL